MARPGRRRRVQRKQLLGLALLAGVGVVVAGLLGALYWADTRTPKLDADTLCPVEGEPPVYVAVLLDVTEPYSQVQREYIEGYMSALLDALPTHGRVSLFALDEDARTDDVRPLVTLCNPGAPGEASPLYQNPERIQERWRTGFRDPLAGLLDRILASEGTRTSPIMEKLQAMAVTAFPRETRSQRRIVLVSDLLQHTPQYSQYQGRPPSIEEFRASPAAARVRVDLRGAELRVLYVRRSGAAEAVQGKGHVAFWEQYVADMNGRLVDVERVPG